MKYLKKRLVKIGFISLFVVAVIVYFVCIVKFDSDKKKKEMHLLDIANSLINETIVNEDNNMIHENIKDENSNIEVVGSNIGNQENVDYANYSKQDKDEKDSKKDVFNKNELQKNEYIIGKIRIPKISVEAPIKDEITQDVLKYAVGHFPQTSYWIGNIALASHNRGSFAHYFARINELNIGDEIIYQTALGTRIYQVYEKRQVDENDLSILNDTNDNELTLITCITNKPKLRLCVKAIEK